jgi:hypothetical protein
MIEAHISAELNLQEPGRGNQIVGFAQHDIDPVAAGQRLQFVRAAGATTRPAAITEMASAS